MAVFGVVLVAPAIQYAPAVAAATSTEDANTATQVIWVDDGDKLVDLLQGAGIGKADAAVLRDAIGDVFSDGDLKGGQKITVQFAPAEDGMRRLLAFSLQLDRDQYLQVARDPEGAFRARRTGNALDTNIIDFGHLTHGDLRTVKVQRGDTIGKILRAQGIDGREAESAIKALRKRFNPRRLKAGQEISVLPAERGKGRTELIGLAVHLPNGRVVEVVRTPEGQFVARRSPSLTLQAPESEQDSSRNDARSNATAGEEVTDRGVVEIRLPKGGTLISLLTAEGASRSEADAAIRALRKRYNPRRLKAGQSVYIVAPEAAGGDRVLEGLSVALDGGSFIHVLRQPNGRYKTRRSNETLTAVLPLTPPDRPEQETAIASVEPETIASAEQEMSTAVPSGATLSAPAQPEPVNEDAVDTESATETAAAVTHYIEEEAEPRSAAQLVHVQRGDTLMAILRGEGIDRREADRAIRALRKVFNPRRLKSGQEIALLAESDPNGAITLAALSIEVGKGRHAELVRSDGGKYSAKVVDEPSFSAQLARARDAEAATAAAEAPLDSTAGAGQGFAMVGAVVAAAAPVSAQEPPAASKVAMATDALESVEKTSQATGLVKEAMALPYVPGVNDGLVRKTINISKGDTLFVALTRAGSRDGDAEAAIAAFRTVHNPRRLQIGQSLSLAFEAIAPDQDGDSLELRLSKLALDVAPDRNVVVERNGDGKFHASEIDRPLVRVLEKAEGRITSSLYNAAIDAGLPIDVLMEVVHIFSFDVDFQREIKRGDSFEVLFERIQNEKGETISHGPILYTTLSLSGRHLELYRYDTDGGPTEYFDANGRSVRKALMKTPINGARLSSRYGMRKHPILGYNRMHRGIDFAARRGTPVLAAGDGVIEKLGRYGAYGKYIRIRHNGTYKTAVAHLDGYARGLKVGKAVRQGQVIGYVGSTGRSTGPHLHYEVLRNGKQINPLELRLPTGQRLEGAQLAEFQAQVRKMKVLLAEVPSSATRVASK